MNKLIFIAILALAGCATKPEIQYVPKEVQVPVTVKCDKVPITKPNKTFDSAKKTDTLYTNLGKLAAENDNLSAYTLQLEAALDKCSK